MCLCLCLVLAFVSKHKNHHHFQVFIPKIEMKLISGFVMNSRSISLWINVYVDLLVFTCIAGTS